uniref:Uncharacterized protein LOC104246136 isoform X1 n=2 Tax=Nicotiana sylvestris TaxID=4096 RepID=A0A1U7YAP8_NICSY|nr:PREDICTED: uncharacterized protein LOC104246136 isoform X1 [Nicotiana sylvestris]
MMKRHREETDSNGAPAIEPATSYNTVFVDTNFDTHLALVVSDSDSVFDLKKKVAFEHLRCFPEMKELKISSVKVKRRGHYYHLSDTMLVRSVFEGIKNGWFLSIDASSCDQRLLCITYAQTEADNHSFTEIEKVFDTNEPYPAHGNLASSSIVRKKKVAKVIREFKTMDELQQLSPGAGPVAKKRHIEEGLATDTHTSKHGIDNDASEFKVVGNDTNEGEREHINTRSKNASAESLPSDHSNKVSKLGKKKCRMGGASAEISAVQDAQCGNRNTDALDETSQSGTIANKVKKLDSCQGSTGFNRRDVAIPENSTQHRPIIKAALAEALEDQSLRTNTAHQKRKKKKGKDSSTCHDEGVEMKIFDKLTDVDTTIQSGLKETVCIHRKKQDYLI